MTDALDYLDLDFKFDMIVKLLPIPLNPACGGLAAGKGLKFLSKRLLWYILRTERDLAFTLWESGFYLRFVALEWVVKFERLLDYDC